MKQFNLKSIDLSFKQQCCLQIFIAFVELSLKSNDMPIMAIAMMWSIKMMNNYMGKLSDFQTGHKMPLLYQ